MSEELTLVVTNYKRPQNLPAVVQAWSKQRLVPRLFLWNNGSRIEDPELLKHFDWIVDSSINMGCVPRWYMASMASTRFTGVVDDDFVPVNPTVTASLISLLKKVPDCGLVGPFGVRLEREKSYADSIHYKYPPTTTMVDIVKGRLATCRTEVLAARLRTTKFLMEDDIAVSAMIASGRRDVNLVIGRMLGKFEELPEDPQTSSAVSRRLNHLEQREICRRECFPSL